ncbi:hypothetical protein [Calothrix sp. 336/3]|uniref:hypothetical protein n=1 Tax=Calothrix sp. 336/3 TaxID=1337936 RepID=UPI000AC4639D
MGRPKKLPEDSIRATVMISETDWEAFRLQAEAMGLNRSELLRMIAQGKVALSRVQNHNLMLGKSLSA